MSDFKQEDHGSISIFYLTGKLNGITSPAIQAAISSAIEKGAHVLILDCSHLEYMSSAGIRVLLRSYHQAGKESTKIVLTSVPKTIEQTLYVTGFLSYFKMYNSTREALKDLQKDRN
ncbi:MAG: STAS domain-containing protein [Victivallaceae bacterium]